MSTYFPGTGNEPLSTQVVTIDEKWVVFCNVRCRSSKPLASTSISESYTNKALISLWWTTQEIIHEEILPFNQTITAGFYSFQLHRLRFTWVVKRPNVVSSTMVSWWSCYRDDATLHPDNTILNTAVITLQKVMGFQWKVLHSPPHSTKYHLFLALNKSFSEKIFDADKSENYHGRHY